MLEFPAIEELLVETKQEAILRFLSRRFGPVPHDVTSELRTIQDKSKLDQLIDFAADCPDLTAFRGKVAAERRQA